MGVTMRVAVFAAIIALSACATDNLRQAPPSGVDFTGRWKLNEPESDDPMHLQQTANAQAAATAGNTGNSGSRAGRGGRGGGVGYPAPVGPATPAMTAMAEALRFPGKQLEIKQVAGVVAFTSEGRNRVCQPSNRNPKKAQYHGNSSDRDAPLPAAREAPPPSCGWFDKTLIVRVINDPDDERPPAEEHYSISEDGQRLVEEVRLKGGRSNGFTMSRVWDRLP
jgi:hypothetical protein